MSGSTIGGVVGGVIGFYFGGPTGAQIGWMIGSAVGNAVDPQVIKGPRPGDALNQTISDVAPRYVVYGIGQVGCNLIQRGPQVIVKHRQRSGKGGGPVQETYTQSRTFAMRVCEGPVAGISRIWADEKLIYDRRDPAQWPDDASAIASLAADTAKTAAKIAIYLGDETQNPDPTLEMLGEEYGGGIGNVPAYRGTCYVVFKDWDLTDRQGSIPTFKFEVVSCGVDTPADPARIGKVFSLNATTASSFILDSDSGTTWDTTEYQTHNVATAAFTQFCGGQLFVLGIGEGKVSADAGLTWTPIAGLTNTSRFSAMTFYGDNSSGTGLYVLYGYDGQLYTSNTGRTFAPRAAAINGFSQYCAAQNGAEILCGLSNRTYGRSTDGGLTWVLHTIPTLGISEGVGLILAAGPWVAFGNGGGGCATSMDGLTWAAGGAYSANMTGSVVAAAVGNGRIIAADANQHTCYSLNAGGSWTAGGNSLSAGAQTVSNGMLFANGKFLLGNGNNISVTTDGGVTWTLAVSGSTGKSSFTYIDGTVGSAIPDAPGWLIDSNGNLHGPAQGYVSVCSDVTVAEVVTDICSRVGLTSAQLDVSQLTDQVRGFVLGQQMPAADAVRALQQGYFFDFPEWDHKLRGIKRGGASVVTITDDDLVWSDEDQTTRAQMVEFPRKVNLESPDPYKSYELTKQTAERRTDNVKAVGELSVQLPITQVADERAQTAEKMLKIAWTEAEGTTEFQLPENFSYLTPSDCFTKDSKRWRITKTEWADGVLKVDGARDRVSAYSSNAAGTPNTSGSHTLQLFGPTRFVAMNLPRLRTADSTLGMYVACCGVLPAWQGARLYLSTDGGESETTVLDMLTPATMGVLTEDFTAGGSAMSVNTTGPLYSATPAQLAARGNQFAVTTNFVSEIGQFSTATDASVGYSLTGLTMAEIGTTAANHNAGNYFVLLDRGVYFLPLDSSLIGKTLIFRAVTLGTDPENNQTFSIVFDPQFTDAESIAFLLDVSGMPLLDADGGYLQEV